jgi:hypothetical protein
MRLSQALNARGGRRRMVPVSYCLGNNIAEVRRGFGRDAVDTMVPDRKSTDWVSQRLK